MPGNDRNNRNDDNHYENLGGVYDFDDFYDEGYESDYRNGQPYSGQPYGQDPYSQDPYGQQQDGYQQRPAQGQPRRQPAQNGSRRPASSGGQRRTSSGSRNHSQPDRRSRQSAPGKSSPKAQKKAMRPEKYAYQNRYEINEGDLKNSKKPYSKKKGHPVKNFFRIFFAVILILVLVVNLMIWHYCGLVNRVDKGKRMKTDASIASDDVRNILLIGSDTRSIEERGRTDSMILLSINKKTKKIYMTSFMRDMYVNIKGYYADGTECDTWGKMNAAYVYGGAELLMDTIEYNFDVQVDEYVYIDFYSFVDIVDAIGGIKMKVSDEEAEGMIPPMAEQNKIMQKEKGSDYLTHGGNLLLNGNQALAYARLRDVGNADFERTSRQREVISKIIDKVKKSGPLTMMDFARTASESLVTNMSRFDLYCLFYKALFSMNYKVESIRIPEDDQFSYATIDGQSVLYAIPDYQEDIQNYLKKEIYGQK